MLLIVVVRSNNRITVDHDAHEGSYYLVNRIININIPDVGSLPIYIGNNITDVTDELFAASAIMFSSFLVDGIEASRKRS
jgi:hypothetical protein